MKTKVGAWLNCSQNLRKHTALKLVDALKSLQDLCKLPSASTSCLMRKLDVKSLALILNGIGK
jgi:hypothetical protein